MKRPKLKDFQEICDAKGGIVSAIARVFNVQRVTVYDWIEKYPKYAEAVEAARDAFLDAAETRLQSLVQGSPLIEKNEETGEPEFKGWITPPSETAIIFTLRTLGKKRGYTERTETELSGHIDKDVNINFSALTNEELLQYNQLLEKIHAKK
ncbi:MAG: hypothetical protein LBE04_05970 [Prevotellaceae bacterium]|jgi:hypothetical protein|nr:hypothetical protein [Prevotellaceae bacterium]